MLTVIRPTSTAAFRSGDVDIPVTFTDGTSTADRILCIRALNPQTTGEDIAGTLGTIVGNVIGGATGTGGGSRGGFLEGIVKVEVQPSAVVVTNNANPTVDIRDNASNNEVQVTGNANGGLIGSSGGSSKKGEKDKSALVNADVDTAGGSSDPRCIAPLVGLGLPLIALVPLALAQQVNVPGLDDLSRQASRAFDDAVRNTGFDAAQLIAAVRTCIPQVRGVDVNINGSSNKSEATKAAPVVDTPTA